MSRQADAVEQKKNKPICLIVEDDIFIRSLHRLWLKKILGDSHEVVCSLSVKTAEVRIRRSQKDRQISAIILDWHFKGEKGKDLINYCNDNGINIPIIIVTADSTVNRQASKFDAVVGFFNKPIKKKKWELIKKLILKHQIIGVAVA